MVPALPGAGLSMKKSGSGSRLPCGVSEGGGARQRTAGVSSCAGAPAPALALAVVVVVVLLLLLIAHARTGRQVCVKGERLPAAAAAAAAAARDHAEQYSTPPEIK